MKLVKRKTCQQLKKNIVFKPYLFMGLILLFWMFSSTVQAQDSISVVGKLSMTGKPIHDVWGYTDSLNNKYALLCASNQGLHVIDLADITNPVLVGSISGGGIEAIDVKVWKQYAYIVGEGNSPGNIIDLSDPTNPVKVGTFPAAHNIVITEFGYMYLSAPGVRIMNLNMDPINPVQTYFDNTCNGHDISIIGTRLFDFAWECGTRIFDVSQPDTLVQIGLVPASGMKHHSGWTSKNGDYLFICDEVAPSTKNDITTWDITDMNSPIMVDSFADPNAFVHNIYVHGDFAYVSYYRAGFRVFDVTDPTNMVLADEYDTDSLISGPGYGGNFGLFTFWGRDSILASDEDNGLYIFKFSGVSTGVQENYTETNLINIYPNPATDMILLNVTKLKGVSEVRIFNTAGKIVVQQTVLEGKPTSISTRNLPNGVFIVEVINGKNRYTKKLIIAN